MPSGIYKHKPLTEEHKKKVSEALRGQTAWNKGKKCPQISEALKGKRLSEEHKRKLSKGVRNHLPSTIFKKGLVPWNKGKVGVQSPSKETKRKISEGIKNHLPSTAFQNGKNHPCWQGGKSFEPYGIEFNKELKERIRKWNGYRCQECFRHQDELFVKTGKKYKLIIHHIDYNKKNNAENNLISLCRNCHAQTNFSREDWIKYFQGRII